MFDLLMWPYESVARFVQRLRTRREARIEARFAATLRGTTALRYRLDRYIEHHKDWALSMSSQYADFGDSGDASWRAMNDAAHAIDAVPEALPLGEYRQALTAALDALIERQRGDCEDEDGFGVGSLHPLQELIDEPLPEELTGVEARPSS